MFHQKVLVSCTAFCVQVTSSKMAKVFVLVFASLIVLQGCLSKATESPLEILGKDAKRVADNITQTLGLQDLTSQKVVKTISEQSQKLATTIEGIIAKIKGEVNAHQGEVDNSVKQIEEQLKKTVVKLQEAAGPEATAKAEDIKVKFNEGFKNAVEQVHKLTEAAQPHVAEVQNSLKAVAKSAYDNLLNIGETIRKEVQKKVAEHERTHKH